VADIFIAIDRSDAERLTDRLIEITTPAHPIDRALVTSEVDRMLRLYVVNAELKEVRFGDAFGELLQLGRRHRLRVPGNLVQFFKTLAMSEGVLLKIHPESSFSDYLRPMAGKLIFQGFVGRQGADHLLGSTLDLAELASDLPRRLDRLLGEIERGNLRVWTRIEDVEPIVKRAGFAPVIPPIVARSDWLLARTPRYSWRRASWDWPWSSRFIIPKDGRRGSAWCSGLRFQPSWPAR
jgi:predicted unusual protein kinase regulating ubiquinone biosynthesis (AarF/ABC1/UbiB family)